MRVTIEQRLIMENVKSRVWSFLLSGTEYLVADAIYTRSYGFNNSSCKMNLNDVSTLLRISRATIKRALKRLEDLGLLSRAERHYEWEYTLINREITQEELGNKVIYDKKFMGLKLPKSKQKNVNPPRVTDEPPPAHPRTPTIKRTTFNKTSSKEVAAGKASYPSGEETTKEKIEGVKKATIRRREKLIEKGKAKKRPAIAEVEAAWVNGCRESFPHNVATSWGVREKGMVTQLLKKMNLPQGLSPVMLFEWFGKNWLWVIEQEFEWMGKKRDGKPAPTEPDIGFLIRWKDEFLNWYNKRNEFEGKRNAFILNRADEKLRARGYSQAEINHLNAEKEAKRNKHKVDFMKPVSKSSEGRKPVCKPKDPSKVRKAGPKFRPTKEIEDLDFSGLINLKVPEFKEDEK